MKISTKRKIVKARKIGRHIGKGVAKAGELSLRAGTAVMEKTKGSPKTIAAGISVWVNTILAPKEFVWLIEKWFTRFNINKDIYDRAIDSVYNTTHMGGSRLHHLLDGQHTIWGAFKAARDASPHDTLFQEMSNATEHLVRDTCSVSGISPLLHVTKEQWNKFASFTHLPKNWLSDALTFNAAELIGASVATLALVFGWSKFASKQFAEYTGALGVVAITSANPLLGLVVIISAARAFTIAKREKDFEKSKLQLAKAALRGTVMPSIFISISVIIGGPVYIGLILGIVVAVLVRKKMDNKKFMEGFSRFLNAYCEDFLKPKAQIIGNIIKDTYAKSHQRIKSIKLPRVKVQVEWR